MPEARHYFLPDHRTMLRDPNVLTDVRRVSIGHPVPDANWD